MSKRDIKTREDIEMLMRSFYRKVIQDETLGIIFTQIVPLNWEHHIPLITDFWETILLDNPVYKNNAMEVHYSLNRIFPLQEKHFKAWLHLFNTTLDEMYDGKIALLAKKRAAGIAALMQHKININNNAIL
ncbi:MAG: group III truncated hemoglobin [Ferruginibacter sp.]